MHLRTALFIVSAIWCAASAQAQDEVITNLEIGGKVSDGEKSLEGVSVYLLTGNARSDSSRTKANGKFGLALALQQEHMIEFTKKGYMTKRMLIDLRVKARPGQELLVDPIHMDVTLLEEKYYEGADTDVLDFPSALVRWDRKLQGFAVDEAYTTGMARANGSVLLVAARDKKK